MTIQDLKKIFDNHSIKNSPKKYLETFQMLKTSFKERMIQLLKDRKRSNRGRPCSINWENFFDCMFSICDNGTKLSYCLDHYGIPRSTYYHYFDIISRSGMLEKFYYEIISELPNIQPDQYLITDTFTVKSMGGSEGLGRNPTDRGRKGLKVSLICDPDLIVRGVHIDRANIHDSKLLEPTIQKASLGQKGIKCLADSGYSGSKYIQKIREQTGMILISQPRRTRNPNKMTHQISMEDSSLLNQKRNGIELLNGQIRSFRSLMIKYVKTIPAYRTYLYLALICMSCHNIFCHSK